MERSMMRADAMSLEPGTRLGPYEILSPLGAGGMGQVYQARDTRLNRVVAIKVSPARFSERFEREARAVAALNHSHICQLYDVGPDYHYEISRNEREVAFTSRTDGVSEIWLAELDRRRPPHRVVRSADQVSFGVDDELIFRGLEEKRNILARVKRDGTGRTQIGDAPILNKFGVSPDGQWAVVGAAGSTENESAATVAVSIRGGPSKKLCRTSSYCRGSWSSTGDFFYLDLVDGRTLVAPASRGGSLPDFPAGGLESAAGEFKLPGTRLIDAAPVAPGPDSSTYVFVKAELQRNLFRIPLH